MSILTKTERDKRDILIIMSGLTRIRKLKVLEENCDFISTIAESKEITASNLVRNNIDLVRSH